MTFLLHSQDIPAVRRAVTLALKDAFKNLKSSEPQLVANLVVELPKRINQLALTGSGTLAAGGVFVHAQPRVTCTTFPAAEPASVEIGDLLLIRTFVINEQVR